MGWQDIAKGVGSSFKSTGANADGSTNPYAGMGQAALGGVFSMMGAKGESDDRNKLLQSQQQNNAADRVGSLQQSIMGDRLTRDKLVSDRNPMGADQQYMQQQLLRNIMFQKMMGGPSLVPMNSKVQGKLDASGWKPFKPTLQDGWETGDSMFGKGMSLDALGQNSKYNSMLSQGTAPQTDYSRVYGASPQTQAMQDEASQYNDYQTGMRQGGQEKWLADAIDGQKAQQAGAQQKKGSIWGKVLKGIGAGASCIPGIGTPIARGATARGTKQDGGSWKQAALAGGMAAVPFGLGKLGGAIGGSAGAALSKFANPMGIGGAAKSPIQNAITSGVGAFGKTFQPQGGGFAGGGLPQPPGPFQNKFAQPPAGFQPMNPSFGVR